MYSIMQASLLTTAALNILGSSHQGPALGAGNMSLCSNKVKPGWAQRELDACRRQFQMFATSSPPSVADYHTFSWPSVYLSSAPLHLILNPPIVLLVSPLPHSSFSPPADCDQRWSLQFHIPTVSANVTHSETLESSPWQVSTTF